MFSSISSRPPFSWDLTCLSVRFVSDSCSYSFWFWLLLLVVGFRLCINVIFSFSNFLLFFCSTLLPPPTFIFFKYNILADYYFLVDWIKESVCLGFITDSKQNTWFAFVIKFNPLLIWCVDMS